MRTATGHSRRLDGAASVTRRVRRRHHLLRTPLHARHAAAAARSSCPSPAGRCPSSTRACGRSTSPCASSAGVFDVSHMGEVETRGPRRPRLPPAHALQRRRQAGRRAAPSTRVLCREDGGILDDLFTYDLRRRRLPDGHERVQPRARTSPGSSGRPRAFDDVEVDRPPRPATRCSPSRGPTPAATSSRLADAGLPGALPHRGAASLDGAPRARLRHGLHGRGRRRDPAPARRRGRRVGPHCSTRASCPAASPRATRSASRSASTSTATTWTRRATRSRPASAGPARRTPGSSAPRSSAPRAANGTAEKLVRLRPHRPRDRAPGQRRAWAAASSRAARSRPSLALGIGMAYLPAASAEPGTAFEIDVRGKTRAAEVRPKPLYRKES